MLAQVDGLLDRLHAAPLWKLPNADTLTLVKSVTAASAKLASVRLKAIAEVDARGTALAEGASSTAGWIRGHCLERMGSAKRQVALARALRQDYPETGAALAAGGIGADAAHVVVKSLRKVPDCVDEATVAAAEANLLQLATVLDPSDLAKAGRRIVFCLDPDGAAEMAAEEAKMAERRELFLTRDETGFWRISGQLDPERGAELHVAIQAFAKPKPSTADGPDLRSAGQRNADALADLVSLALASDGLPSTGGHQPLVIVQIPLATLQAKPGAGPAMFTDGTPLSPEAARRIARDAKILPIVLGSGSQPLDAGRTTRNPTLAQRLAVLARDHYRCQTPHCGNHPRHIHHIWHWADGGPTDLDNLVALCGHCHRYIHSNGNIWTITPVAGGSPAFIRTSPAP